MSDLKERLDKELASVVPAADARAAIDRRVARRQRRRTILLGPIALTLAIGLIAGLTYAFSFAPGREDRTHDGETARAHLIAAHGLLEGLLGELWSEQAQLDLLRGEIEVAREELAVLVEAIGPDPTDAQLLEIERLQVPIGAWTQGAEESKAEISHLRARVEEARARRDALLPVTDAGLFPDVATITCDGDGMGGTHVSTPVVRSQADGVHFRVVNQLSNERVFLTLEPGDEPRGVSQGETEDFVVPSLASGDVEIVCTYVPPLARTWERPSHPLWIATNGPLTGPDTSGEPGPDTSGAVCDFPSVRPTYLPWLAPGIPLPEPEMDRWAERGGPLGGVEPGYSVLGWSNGDVKGPGPARDIGSVALWRATESVMSFPEDPEVPALPDGSTGRLDASEGGGADWSIVWGDPAPDVMSDDCTETTLVAHFPNLSKAEGKREIIRIAESLEPR